MPVMRNVPTTSGSTPKLAGSNSGVHLRAEQELPDADLAEEADRLARAATITIPVVVRTEIRAASDRAGP